MASEVQLLTGSAVTYVIVKCLFLKTIQSLIWKQSDMETVEFHSAQS